MSPTQAVILLLVLIVLIVLSGLFSAAETSYSTASKIRLKNMENDGNKGAGKVLKMLDNYDRVLSTVLIGNNIVNITGASLATVLFGYWMPSHAELSVTISTIVMTAVVLIFGEITPKSISKEMPEKFAIFIRPFLAFLQILLFPLNLLFSGWKWMLKKVFRLKDAAGFTEDELITIVETAQNEGGIDEHESKLIKSAIEFEDLDIDDIMVPRVNVLAVDRASKMGEIAKLFRENGFSRLPVYSGTIDTVVGIIHEKDFYNLYYDEEDDIGSIMKAPLCVSANMKISSALRLLQKAKIHMAVVVDEFGGTAGIVTLEDILEELVGEIWDEHDTVEETYKKLNDNTYLVAGSQNLEDMFEYLGLNVKEEFDSMTVGGWVTEQMRKIPVTGETFNYMNMTVTVVKSTVKKVSEIKVELREEEDEDIISE